MMQYTAKCRARCIHVIVCVGHLLTHCVAAGLESLGIVARGVTRCAGSSAGALVTVAWSSGVPLPALRELAKAQAVHCRAQANCASVLDEVWLIDVYMCHLLLVMGACRSMQVHCTAYRVVMAHGCTLVNCLSKRGNMA